MTPHQLAEIIRRAHAIGEHPENQYWTHVYPREWQDMIVAALEALGVSNKIVKALETALVQWNNYADIGEEGAEDSRLIRTDEGDLYHECRRTLAAAKLALEGQKNVKQNVDALEAFGDAQAGQVTPGWIDAAALQAAREIAAITWTYTSKVPAIQVIVAREMMRAASQMTSTQEKLLSVCSQCGGKDPDCCICGTVVASTEGK
jgi:hypothetical protein